MTARPSFDIAAANLQTLRNIADRVSLVDGVLHFDKREVTEKRYGLPRVYGDVALEAKPVIPDEYPTAVKALGQGIYGEVYSYFSSDLLRYAQNTDKLRDEAFVQEIRNAHSSRWSWVGNFQFVSEEKGLVKISGRYWGEVTTPRQNIEGPDGSGRVRLRRETTNETMQPSFIHLLGEEAIPVGEAVNSRLYWNIGPEGAIPLVRTLSGTLNKHRVPFQYKVLKRPRSMDRPDTAVLYFPRYAIRRIEEVLPEIYDEVKTYLRWSTPPFTKRLAPGVAYSEDPGNGRSFGESRCQLLALLIWDALQAGATTPGALTASLVHALEERGYPLERLHLNPGSDVDIRVDLEPVTIPLEEFALA